jgi:hypothetical protein
MYTKSSGYRVRRRTMANVVEIILCDCRVLDPNGLSLFDLHASGLHESEPSRTSGALSLSLLSCCTAQRGEAVGVGVLTKTQVFITRE